MLSMVRSRQQSRTASTAVETPAKRKRALTESRKKQNREAQQRFRNRRKAKHHAVPTVHLHSSLDLETFGIGELCTDALYSIPLTSNNTVEAQDCTEISTIGNVLEPTIPSDLFSGGSLSSFADQALLSFSMPSPYLNYLQIQKFNFYAARIQNAMHIGVPPKLAETEHTLSPWYWDTQFSLLVLNTTPPGSSFDISRPPTVSNGVIFPARFGSFAQPLRPQRCFHLNAAVSSDLSPTQLQREKPHALYIDMIPFPILRDRIITLLSMDPPAFDEDELRFDMENDGLRVWGAGVGTGKGVEGMVRDKRNWECANWFFRKWKILVNGSGLDEQSQWWRRMRGEDDDEDPSL